jgi:hypothetical protein
MAKVILNDPTRNGKIDAARIVDGVIVISENNPDYASIMLEQPMVEFKNGFATIKNRTLFVNGTKTANVTSVESLRAFIAQMGFTPGVPMEGFQINYVDTATDEEGNFGKALERPYQLPDGTTKTTIMGVIGKDGEFCTIYRKTVLNAATPNPMTGDSMLTHTHEMLEDGQILDKVAASEYIASNFGVKANTSEEITVKGTVTA